MGKIPLLIGVLLLSFLFGQFLTAILDDGHRSLPQISLLFAIGVTCIVWGLL